MSMQKGNTKRSRPQKYKNQFAFKNNLHDTSHKTKAINNLHIANVCERCKKIIEWKIKYKKYKPLKAPGKCNKCEQKTVKYAYHTMCGPCAKKRNVCPKCESNSDLVPAQPTKQEQMQLDAEMQQMLKTLQERKRRTFIRYMNKESDKKKKKPTNKENSNYEERDNSDNSDKEDSNSVRTRDNLIGKLKSLMIDKDIDDDNLDSESDDYGDDDDGDDEFDDDDKSDVLSD
ncbi:uncharacterized protein C9orf85 homolog [Phymastichus coffea]|uniref:uncharacterized protein C9orf85 homolog n=1 Tax=Phymastichus coffea TaxID=108790 RepID=UPI00273BB566|nr:uncharacterized protein C9orf85 homolog [Phymastichus coffea]